MPRSATAPGNRVHDFDLHTRNGPANGANLLPSVSSVVLCVDTAQRE
jgi:hypothetical protein